MLGCLAEQLIKDISIPWQTVHVQMLQFLYLTHIIKICSFSQQQDPLLSRIEVCNTALHFGFLGMFADKLSRGISPDHEILQLDKLKVRPNKNNNLVHRIGIMQLIPELPLKKLKSHFDIIFGFVEFQLIELFFKVFYLL